MDGELGVEGNLTAEGGQGPSSRPLCFPFTLAEEEGNGNSCLGLKR